jgi:hypothetical protein
MSQFSTYLQIIQEEKYDFLFNESDDNRKLVEDLNDKIANAVGISVFAANLLLSILLYHGTKYNLIEPVRVELAAKVKNTIKNWYKIKKEEKDKKLEELKQTIADYLNNNELLKTKLENIETKEQAEEQAEEVKKELTSRDKN